MDKTRLIEWRTATIWGFKIALAHRIVLLMWMVFVWVAIGQPQHIPVDLHVDPIAKLPALTSFEQATLGVWRRWDASHYLNLAQNGYRTDDPGPTVFGALTPIVIHLIDIVLPGGVDIAGMAFATAAFWLALILLYRVCAVYYDDPDLGRWATITLAILPHSFFLSAPMSDAIYLAMVLGVFWAATKSQWLLGAIFGSLATFARHQGILLAGILALLIFQESLTHCTSWRQRTRYIVSHAWPLIFMVGTFSGFILFRQGLGLPSLGDTYIQYSYSYIANPFSGIVANISWTIQNPLSALFNPDLWALVVCFLLTWKLWRNRTYSRPIFIFYILLYSLLFISRVNYVWGAYEQTTNTQSFARYSLAFFPLTVLIAAKLRDTTSRTRLLVMGVCICGLFIFSALFTLGGGTP